MLDATLSLSTSNSMLAAMLDAQYAQLAALAEAWLDVGAAAFGIWSNGRALVCWPPEGQLQHPGIVAPIRVGGGVIGDLRVVGIQGAAAQARLKAEAEIIAHLLKLEDELQCMTAELVDSQDQLLAMYQLTQSMRRHVTIDDTLQSLVFEAVRLVRARAGFAMFVPANSEPTLVQYPPHSIDESGIWNIFWQTHASERDMLVMSDQSLHGLPAGIDNLLFIPFGVRGTMMAGLGLINKPGTGFTAPNIKLARAIVEQASAHIEHVQLHLDAVEQTRLQTEVDLARRVQLRLLPQQLPRVDKLDIYASSRPALQVGGDFYDFVAQSDRPFIFSVADVTGKGMAAALLMTMTRTAIHSKASFMPKPTPEIVMKNSNEDLYEDFIQVGMFATAFIGQYQPHSQKLLYANAGHSPVIYRPVGGSARLLEADSTPIGVLQVSLCKNHQVPLGPGDVLVVATDGFSEARNPADEMFGYDRLLELVDQVADRSAHLIANALFEAVGRFGVGRPQDDDQTLVVIKGAAA
jgi:sigma-B regulation protein RsbU (phosphoserine phosphatase)